MAYTLIMTNGELYHHGVKGQKWGVRRYQNHDGTLTTVGRRHKLSTDKKRKPMSKETKKKIAVGVGTIATATALTALGIYTAKNPEAIKAAAYFVKHSRMKTKDISKPLVSSGKKALENMDSYAKRQQELNKVLGPVQKLDNAKMLTKNTTNKIKDAAKYTVKTALKGITDGNKSGVKEGPEKLAKAVVIGGIMYGGKKVLDKSLGSDVSDSIMRANDKEQIGKYWKKKQQN